jgi:cytochrome bd-type quinol oxidase subunit 2
LLTRVAWAIGFQIATVFALLAAAGLGEDAYPTLAVCWLCIVLVFVVALTWLAWRDDERFSRIIGGAVHLLVSLVVFVGSAVIGAWSVPGAFN